jgi:hypothetical protein
MGVLSKKNFLSIILVTFHSFINKRILSIFIYIIKITIYFIKYKIVLSINTLKNWHDLFKYKYTHNTNFSFEGKSSRKIKRAWKI